MRIALNAVILGQRDVGVGVWARGLIRALQRADGRNSYVVYCRAGAEPPVREGGRFHLAPVRIPAGNRMARILWEQLLLPRRLRRDGVDLLHCPAYVMPVRSPVPTVVTLHDLFALTHPEVCKRLNVLHYRLMIPRSVRQAAALHCTSAWTAKVLAGLFPGAGGKCRVIHPAIDHIFRPQKAASVERFRRRAGLRHPPFLFVGNVEPKKNVPLLLDALRILKDRHASRRKLLMVGGQGWGVPRVDRMAERRDLQGQVVRLGYVERADLPGAYGCALALVFPSRIEGFGLPPLEAMACGTPVITTSAGGLPESTGDAALVLRRPNAESLAAAMHRVESSPALRRELTQKGLRRAEAFRWEKVVGAYLELYERVAAHCR